MNIESPSLTPLPPSTAEVFWETNRQKIVASIIVLIVILFIIGGTLLWRRSYQLTADTLLSDASDRTGWQKIVTHYPHSEAAAAALLLIAAAQRNEHQLEASNATYAHFLKQFSQHPLAISALIGEAMNDDLAGHPDQASNHFQQAAVAYPKSYGAPFALLSRVRLLARLGKTEEIPRALQMISSQYPNSLVTRMFLRQGGMR